MKIKNSQIFIAIITFLGVYILLAGYLKFTKPIEIPPKVELEPKIEPKALSVESEPETEIIPKTLSEQTNKINVSLSVLDESYQIDIKEGSSVFGAMKDLQIKEGNNFDFKYKEYPSMGAFVYEINGVKEKRGEYWIYYVNEKEASVGVSSYILSEGDSILWKQE